MPARIHKPLTAREAYLAGLADFEAAKAAAHKATIKFHPNADFNQVFRSTLADLWQARIDRGELPSLLEKAS
jgi:hypothetical protein